MRILRKTSIETEPRSGEAEEVLSHLLTTNTERSDIERAAARVNRCPETLAQEDAQEKFLSFQLYVTGESDCTRSERFTAHFHVEDNIHQLQHDAFLDVFGIEPLSLEELGSSGKEQIVKVDDPDNPSVAIKRRLLFYENGDVYGVSYIGFRLGEQNQ